MSDLENSDYISNLEISARARHALRVLGVHDDETLMAVTQEELSRIRSCGRKTLNEIVDLQSDIDDRRSLAERQLDQLRDPTTAIRDLERKQRDRAWMEDDVSDPEWFEQKLVAVVVVLNDLMSDARFDPSYSLRLMPSGGLILTKDLV